MGAWIETLYDLKAFDYNAVAPFMGAWIETTFATDKRKVLKASLPSWERGLKLPWDCLRN